MKICLLCTEIFAWGKYGGFGRATRLIGRELVKNGVEVYAIVPQRKGQKSFEILDGIKVYSFPITKLFFVKELAIRCNADIYHSQEPSFLTFLAMRSAPDKYHIITSRDPKNFSDWLKEFIHPSHNKLQVIANILFENNHLVTKSVRRADKVFKAAIFLDEKIRKKYSLMNEIQFLPTPIKIPSGKLVKSETPTVCFLGRMDKRKNPELFFQIAKSFPEVNFIAIGKGRNESYDKYLRSKYSSIKNLMFTGFINQFESNEIDRILAESWVLINTASREGLPNSFLEAMANKSAILSSLNPEDVTRRFGFLVTNNNYVEGLNTLLQNDNWKHKGEEAQKYVKENYELNSAVEQHLKVYNDLLTNGR